MLYIGQNKKTYAKVTPMSPSLNYLTLQHRQRQRAERMATTATMPTVPKRNLQSILDGQMGEENRRISNSPNQNIVKSFNKPKIEPVKLDDSTMELVNALTKPRKSTSSNFGERSVDANTAFAGASIVKVEATSSRTSVSSMEVVKSVKTLVSTPAKSTEEPIRSPFAALCEFTAPASASVLTTSTTTSSITTTTNSEDNSSYLTTTTSTIETTEELIPMDIDTYDQDTEDSASGAFNDRKRKHGRGGRLLARRGTLSPASVRAMLLEVCDPDSQGDGNLLGDPFAMLPNASTSASANAMEDMCVDSVIDQQTLTTPVKSKPSSPIVMHTANIGTDSIDMVEAQHTSPFSIRTALELRRSPMKSPLPSPATIAAATPAGVEPADGVMDVQHIEPVAGLGEGKVCDHDSMVTCQEEQPQEVLGQGSEQEQVELENELEQHEQGQEQEMKKARSGSPSAASTRSFIRSPLPSPVSSPVPSPVLSSAISPTVCVGESVSRVVSTVVSPVPPAVTHAIPMASPAQSAPVYDSHVDAPEVHTLVEDPSSTASISTNNAIHSLETSDTQGVAANEFSPAEMEVIEDFGRELDDLLCDTDVGLFTTTKVSNRRSSIVFRRAATPVSDSKNSSSDTSSWEGSNDADVAFIFSAPATPASPLPVDSVHAFTSPVAASFAPYEASPEVVEVAHEEVHQAVVVTTERDAVTHSSPEQAQQEELQLVDNAEGAAIIYSSSSPRATESPTEDAAVAATEHVTCAECEESEMDSVSADETTEEDSGFSFIDQVAMDAEEAEAVSRIPSIPTPTPTPLKEECSVVTGCDVTVSTPSFLAVSVGENEAVVASAPSPVPVVSLPRLASRMRTPVTASPSVQLPLSVSRSPVGMVQASPLASVSTPSSKALHPSMSSSASKTPLSQLQQSSAPAAYSCMPPTPPSVPRAHSAALSPKVAAYFSPFASAATPASGSMDGSRLNASARSSTGNNTPASSRGSHAVRSPYSCTSSSAANSAYSSRSRYSGAGQDMDNSMDDSVLLFRYDQPGDDEDLETFEMLESMVQREYCEGSVVDNTEVGNEWSFDAPVELEEVPLTAHSTDSSPAPAVRNTNDCSESEENVCGLPVEGVHEPSSPSRGPASSSFSSSPSGVTASDLVTKPAVVATPHPRTPQKKTPEQRSAGSSERKRRGLTFIPRYAISPAAARSQPVAAVAEREGSVSEGSTSVLNDFLDVSVCTALAAADCEVSLADIVAPSLLSTSTPLSATSAVQTAEESVYPEPFDLTVAQAAAKARYEARMQEARWQYDWELASAHMTHAVIQRHQNLQN